MKYYILTSWDGVLFFVGNANPEKTIVTGKLVAYTTNYYRWYSEYEHKTPYTPTSLGVERFYPMSVLTSSGEPFTELTEAEFNEEMNYYKEKGELVTDKGIVPIKELEFNGDPDCQRDFIENVVYYLKECDILTLWNMACKWFGMPMSIEKNKIGFYTQVNDSGYATDLYALGVDDDTIVDYLLDAMEHGELSILNDGTIKF